MPWPKRFRVISSRRQICAPNWQETRAEIVRWVAGLIGFQTLAIIGAVVALARSLH